MESEHIKNVLFSAQKSNLCHYKRVAFSNWWGVGRNSKHCPKQITCRHEEIKAQKLMKMSNRDPYFRGQIFGNYLLNEISKNIEFLSES